MWNFPWRLLTQSCCTLTIRHLKVPHLSSEQTHASVNHWKYWWNHPQPSWFCLSHLKKEQNGWIQSFPIKLPKTHEQKGRFFPRSSRRDVYISALIARVSKWKHSQAPHPSLHFFFHQELSFKLFLTKVRSSVRGSFSTQVPRPYSSPNPWRTHFWEIRAPSPEGEELGRGGGWPPCADRAPAGRQGWHGSRWAHVLLPSGCRGGGWGEGMREAGC